MLFCLEVSRSASGLPLKPSAELSWSFWMEAKRRVFKGQCFAGKRTPLSALIMIALLANDILLIRCSITGLSWHDFVICITKLEGPARRLWSLITENECTSRLGCSRARVFYHSVVTKLQLAVITEKKNHLQSVKDCMYACTFAAVKCLAIVAKFCCTTQKHFFAFKGCFSGCF